MACVMLDIDEILPDVHTYAPHAVEPLVFRFLRETARILCQRLAIWRDNDTIDYDPECPCVVTLADANIVSIERADLDGAKLQPKTVPWLDEYAPQWEEVEGIPRFITQKEPDTIFIAPQKAGTLTLRLTLQPSLSALSLPKILVENYRPLLARGTAGYLLTSPQGDTANPQLGAALLQTFMSALDRLEVKALKTQTGARLRTTPHFF